MGLGGGVGGSGLGGACLGGHGGMLGGEGGDGGGLGGGEGGDSSIRSPYKERAREFFKEASLENHVLRNHVLRDQKETGRVAQVHKDVVGQGSHITAVQ